MTLSTGCHQFATEQKGPASPTPWHTSCSQVQQCFHQTTWWGTLSPSWGSFSGSQDMADPLKAVNTCAEVLACLQRRRVDWLVLFQLTETGEEHLRDWKAGYCLVCDSRVLSSEAAIGYEQALLGAPFPSCFLANFITGSAEANSPYLIQSNRGFIRPLATTCRVSALLPEDITPSSQTQGKGVLSMST